MLGRVTTRDDGTAVPPVMVLTHEYWMKRFGGDRASSAKRCASDGKAVTVVGVVQPAPYFPVRMDALLNMVISEHHTSAMMVHGRTHRMTEMIARLAPGATVEQARSEVDDHPRARAERSSRTPTMPARPSRRVIPFQEVLGEQARLTLWLLMGAAAFVMIITAANVANLTLMRGVRREHELVVRAALGAGARGSAGCCWWRICCWRWLGARSAWSSRAVACSCSSRSPSATRRARTRSGSTAWCSASRSRSRWPSLLLSFARTAARRHARHMGRPAANRVSGSLAQAAPAACSGRRADRGFGDAADRRGTAHAHHDPAVGSEHRTQHGRCADDGGAVLTRRPAVTTCGCRARRYDRMRLEVAAMPGVKEVGVGSVDAAARVEFQLEIKAEGSARAGRGDAARRVSHSESGVLPRRRHSHAQRPRRSRTDRAGSALVVILNQTLADKLFPDKDPIGQRVAWTGDVLRFTP